MLGVSAADVRCFECARQEPTFSHAGKALAPDVLYAPRSGDKTVSGRALAAMVIGDCTNLQTNDLDIIGSAVSNAIY